MFEFPCFVFHKQVSRLKMLSLPDTPNQIIELDLIIKNYYFHSENQDELII